MLVYLCIHVRLSVFDVCACVCEYMYILILPYLK